MVRQRLKDERRPSGRISDALRREVVEATARARKTGLLYRDIAKKLGVSFHTMMSWRQREKHGRLERVRVKASSPRPSPTVHGPRGMRVEGLTVAEIAELWLRLS